MFVIEVKEKDTDEHFIFKDVLKTAKVYCEICGAIRVKWKKGFIFWTFLCQRCRTKTRLIWRWYRVDMILVAIGAICGEGTFLPRNVSPHKVYIKQREKKGPRRVGI